MALRDGVVNLILRARNLISKPTEEAAGSMSGLQAEADKLEETLDDLGRQEQAIKGFDDTKKAAEQATAELGRTVAEYERLRTRGRQAGESQAEYSLAVKQARAAQSLANSEYRRAQRELGQHTRTLNRAGIETDDLTAAEKRVQVELEKTRRELDRVNEETAEHAARLDAASASGQRFSGLLGALQTRLLGLLAGIGVLETLRRGFMELLDAGGGLEDLRLRLDGVFGSMEAGAAALAQIDQLAEDNAQSLEDTAEAALRLKSFGIDPLNGSLQAFIDVNAKYGQGAQTLTTLTTQMGQAWASNRLQLEELNSITDAGIPILQALEQVTGRAVGQIRDMASAGELGRDTMRDLIEQFGEMAEGSGAARINGINGLLRALRKEIRDLFRTASENGALDILKQKLRELLTTLRRAEEDGSTRRWAQGLVEALETAAVVGGRVASLARIGVNSITALWRTAAAAITGSASAVAGAVSAAADAVGADGLARQLDALSAKARDVSSGFLDGVRQDGRDIADAFADLFGGAARQAEESGDQQVAAQKAAHAEILASSEALAAKEKALAEETRASKRVSLLQEQRDAAESAEKREAIERQLQAAVVVLSRKRAESLRADRAAEAAAAREAAAEQRQAVNGLRESLDDLGLEYDELAGIVEQKALASFEKVVEQVEKSGAEAKVQSRIIAQAYQAAFDEINSRAGQLQAVEQLNEALRQGLITQKDYNEAVKETGTVASETLDRLQRAIKIYQETTALAVGAEKEKAQAAKDTGEALDAQAEAADDAATSMERASDRAIVAGAGITEAAENIRLAFYNVSQEAGALYDNLLREQTRGLVSTRSYLTAVGDVAAEVNDRVGRAEQLYQRAMAAQNEDTEQFINLAGRAIASGKVLGEERLSGLRSALASAKAQMDGLADSARNTVQGLQDELLQLTGTQDEIQRRQYERRRQDLEQQRRDANAAGAGDAAAQYREALQLNEQIYNARRDQQRNERIQREQNERERPTKKTEVQLKAPSGDSVTVEAAEGDDVRFLKILEEAGLRSASR